MKHIFFVEDDLSLINGLSFAIKKQGYELTVARTSVEAEQLWENRSYDLVILDVTLPDGSGFDLCRKIRASSKVPIMFLTAADEETDIIMGLDIGGDDYMTKPFKLAVFLSRINALLRRSENFNQEQAEPELQSNGIRVQLLKQEVTKNGVPLDLTASEYKLLRLFMENPNIILSPEQILSKLWDCDEKYIDNNTLTVYIRRLRTKVEDNPADPQKIVCVFRAFQQELFSFFYKSNLFQDIVVGFLPFPLFFLRLLVDKGGLDIFHPIASVRKHKHMGNGLSGNRRLGKYFFHRQIQSIFQIVHRPGTF